MKHVVFSIGSLTGGGAERVVSVWASALAEKGYKVSLLLYSRVNDEYLISEKVNVYTIAKSMSECNQLSILKRVKRFRKLLKQLSPNVVISFLPAIQVYIRIASIGLKIPRIETIRISPWNPEISKIKFSKIWKNCFESSDAVILQSEDQKAFFSKKVQNKSVVIPNPINNSYLENKKGNYDSSSHKIVAAGRLTEQKNYKMLIDAIKIVSKVYNDVLLEIYGEGNLKDNLFDYVNELGLENNVKLMGRSNQLYNVYKGSDLYIMSSDYEGLPNALAEAMAIGLPCISTDCKTGPRDLIDDGENGFLVPCGDAKVLAERIKYVFSLSDDEQNNIGQKAREKIISFCGEKNSLGKLVTLIEKIS